MKLSRQRNILLPLFLIKCNLYHAQVFLNLDFVTRSIVMDSTKPAYLLKLLPLEVPRPKHLSKWVANLVALSTLRQFLHVVRTSVGGILFQASFPEVAPLVLNLISPNCLSIVLFAPLIVLLSLRFPNRRFLLLLEHTSSSIWFSAISTMGISPVLAIRCTSAATSTQIDLIMSVYRCSMMTSVLVVSSVEASLIVALPDSAIFIPIRLSESQRWPVKNEMLSAISKGFELWLILLNQFKLLKD